MATYNVTLNLAAPTPTPLQVNPGRRDIEFTNSTGADTVLTADNGVFNPNPPSGEGIPIAKDGTWSGTVGNSSGDYYYTVPGEDLGTRSGRINV